MGCHTWCYKRVDRSIEEARTIWIKEQIKLISKWLKILDNPNDTLRIAYGWNKEYCENSLVVSIRQLIVVQKGLCNKAVMNRQPELSIYIEGKGFFIEEGTHNPFRIYGYPNDLLFSFDECIEYIKKYEKEKNEKVEIYNNSKNLKTFWEKNPDGMICFG